MYDQVRALLDFASVFLYIRRSVGRYRAGAV
jgi:hypothetical protein